MSEPGVHMGWRVRIKGADRMATRPAGHYCHTQGELDWYLEHYGPADKYDITREPDYLSPAERADLERRCRETLAREKAQHDTP